MIYYDKLKLKGRQDGEWKGQGKWEKIEFATTLFKIVFYNNFFYIAFYSIVESTLPQVGILHNRQRVL